MPTLKHKQKAHGQTQKSPNRRVARAGARGRGLASKTSRKGQLGRKRDEVRKRKGKMRGRKQVSKLLSER